MEIRISEMKRSEFGTVHMELSCGKKTAYVGIDKDGGVQVCAYNASHKAWGGCGKYYRNKEQALSMFKSAEMRAIVEAAFEAVSSSSTVTH